MKAVFLAGRLIFGGYFLYNAFNHFKNYKPLGQYARSKNVPYGEAGVIASGALLALGGTSLATGWEPRIGGAAILAFLASVSPTMHDFWNAPDAGQRMNDQAHFAKNLALAGAALALMGVEAPWPASLRIS